MSINTVYAFLEQLETLYWGYIGIYIILISGIYFTIKSRFHQLKVLFNFKNNLKQIYSSNKNSTSLGLSPIRLYFASVGGMIGLGNVVAISTAITIGGPGALLWLWIASIIGMLIKYSEIYLGIKYRIANINGYQGGSIYYLKSAFKSNLISIIAAFMLGIYGVEVYQFTVVSDSLTNLINNFYPTDKIWIVGALLILILYSSLGGIKRLAIICSNVMPIFIIVYIVICLIIIIINLTTLPATLWLIIKCAFVGHAPVGGFIGSGLLLAIQQGIARAVYSGDIGIGYDSIIQSETSLTEPAKQANMAIFASLTDILVCTMSVLIIIITGTWQLSGVEQASQYVTLALSKYFPFADIFMYGLIFVAGYTTIIAYLAVGIRCAEFLNKKYGKLVYFLYASGAFLFFSYFEQAKLIIIMSICGGILVLLNVIGILKLRKEIKFISF